MDSAKLTLIGTVAALIALVAIFMIMADCSKHISDVEASPKAACSLRGGVWFKDTPNRIGYCVEPRR
jgi:hypothetical protein